MTAGTCHRDANHSRSDVGTIVVRITSVFVKNKFLNRDNSNFCFRVDQFPKLV
jgi:hypothetical protein